MRLLHAGAGAGSSRPARSGAEPERGRGPGCAGRALPLHGVCTADGGRARRRRSRREGRPVSLRRATGQAAFAGDVLLPGTLCTSPCGDRPSPTRVCCPRRHLGRGRSPRGGAVALRGGRGEPPLARAALRRRPHGGGRRRGARARAARGGPGRHRPRAAPRGARRRGRGARRSLRSRAGVGGLGDVEESARGRAARGRGRVVAALHSRGPARAPAGRDLARRGSPPGRADLGRVPVPRARRPGRPALPAGRPHPRGAASRSGRLLRPRAAGGRGPVCSRDASHRPARTPRAERGGGADHDPRAPRAAGQGPARPERGARDLAPREAAVGGPRCRRRGRLGAPPLVRPARAGAVRGPPRPLQGDGRAHEPPAGERPARRRRRGRIRGRVRGGRGGRAPRGSRRGVPPPAPARPGGPGRGRARGARRAPGSGRRAGARRPAARRSAGRRPGATLAAVLRRRPASPRQRDRHRAPGRWAGRRRRRAAASLRLLDDGSFTSPPARRRAAGPTRPRTRRRPPRSSGCRRTESCARQPTPTRRPSSRGTGLPRTSPPAGRSRRRPAWPASGSARRSGPPGGARRPRSPWTTGASATRRGGR